MVESEGLLNGEKWQKMLRDFVEMDEDHPFTATRIKELLRWGNDKKYIQLANVMRKLITSE